MIDENESGIVKCDFCQGGGEDSLILSPFPLWFYIHFSCKESARLSVDMPSLMTRRKFLWMSGIDWKQTLEF